MPTYDYRCRQCGTTYEVIHSMLESGPTTCERCGGELRRVLHPAGIIFKGSGFYKTDARAASSPKPAAAAKSDTGSGTATGADAGSAKTGKSDSASASGGSASGSPSPSGSTGD